MLLIDDNIVTKEEVKIIDDAIINNPYFPWNYEPYSSSESYPFYGHTLVSRHSEEESPIASSDWFFFFKKIMNRFMVKNDLLLGGYKVLRACLNDSLSFKEKSCDIHVDYPEKHIVFILYLTESTGNTNIYIEKWEESKPTTYLNKDGSKDLKLLKSVKPKKGRLLCVDGLHYHNIDFKKELDRRIICIFALKEK
jgi:hypothetical protein